MRGFVQCCDRGRMGASEKTYRLYGCGRCAQQVRICRDCNRGNLYCAGECAQIRRRESLHRAGERYQLGYRGACRHAARQSTWRERHAQKVTHQGSLPSVDTLIVVAIPTQTATEEPHVDMASIQPPAQPHSLSRVALSTAPMRAYVRWLVSGCPRGTGHWYVHRMAPAAQRCSFCWRALPPFARLGPLRGGP